MEGYVHRSAGAQFPAKPAACRRSIFSSILGIGNLPSAVCALLSSHCCSLNSSLLWTHGFTVLLQSLQSSATASQPVPSPHVILSNQRLARVLVTPSWCD